jgi:hypothetical protein
MNQPTKSTDNRPALDAALMAAAGFAEAGTESGSQREPSPPAAKPRTLAETVAPKPTTSAPGQALPPPSRASRPLAVSQMNLAEFATRRDVAERHPI